MENMKREKKIYIAQRKRNNQQKWRKETEHIHGNNNKKNIANETEQHTNE